jgi:hypothetical protein
MGRTVRNDDTNQPSRLSPQQLRDLLGLLDHVRSVELKLTVRDTDRAPAIAALDLDVLEAELRQVVFFDTRDLTLNRAGIVLRARRIRKGGDVIVKLRPIDPAALPKKVRRSDGFTVELDAMPGAFVCSGTLKAEADNADIRRVLAGKRSIRNLFDDGQRSLFEAHAPRHVSLDSLKALGPVNIAKMKCSPRDFADRTLVAELWLYPDGSRVLELSTKCAPEDALRVAADARVFLSERGIAVTADQDSKTHRALHYFAQLHAADGSAPRSGRRERKP